MADESGLPPTESRTELPSVSPAMSPGAERMLATPEDLAAFEQRFMRLLERRTAIYTMGDSTSVPKHVAVDLLRSVSFILGIDPERRVIPDRLLRVDLEDEFRRNLVALEAKVERTAELWREASVSMPSIPNTALHDTLAEIGNFPRNYDFRSMAHEIPASIDYPLCHPVPEDLPGVDYINEYLTRLLLEAGFLHHFETGECIRVLERSSPDYVDLLINLYEPVATNAIGRALIGKDPRPLRIAEDDCAWIEQRLKPLGAAQRSRMVCEAAQAVCASLGITDPAAREYLRALAPELLPRIKVGLANGGLRGVFVG